MKKCKEYLGFFWRICSAHVVTYMIMGRHPFYLTIVRGLYPAL